MRVGLLEPAPIVGATIGVLGDCRTRRRRLGACRGASGAAPTLEPLMTAAALTAENFDATITGNDIVVVDFWAPWCGPCKGFAPIFDEVAVENPDLVFVKVNTDEEQALAGH